ncbi:hypothetical protein Harman_39170 [Haloarcula mannanilytica]|uniref:Uncharacterized protein n=1 Tax=Haloarcula mannanilytica TaxID=2509225 RepID=A0A4C2EP03_9EURY|nr:hypothetical protein [Haloarcula mannanilytica]GCF15982.1 hypothetical protein Harman_39170 [Haloarcula mannanilytica]
MTSEDEPVQYHTLNKPADLRASLDETGIEYLDVDAYKTIVIYQSAVLVVIATDGHATEATAFTVELWEPPADGIEREADDLLTTFIDRVVPADTTSQ